MKRDRHKEERKAIRASHRLAPSIRTEAGGLLSPFLDTLILETSVHTKKTNNLHDDLTDKSAELVRPPVMFSDLSNTCSRMQGEGQTLLAASDVLPPVNG